MPTSYSWEIISAPLSGSSPGPGVYVPQQAIFGTDPRKKQFERGIKFANAPGNRADMVVHGGPRVQHINSLDAAHMNPMKSIPRDGTYSGAMKFRFRSYRNFGVPSSVNKVEYRSSDRYTNPILDGTGVYQADHVWFTTGSVTFSTNQMAHARTVATANRLNDSRIIVIGGNESSSLGFATTPSASIFASGTTGSWTQIASMPTPKQYHAAVTLSGSGDVVVFGGVNDIETLTEEVRAYRYVTTSGTWIATSASSSIPRLDFQVVQLQDGTVFLPGGRKTGLTPTGITVNGSSNTKAYWNMDSLGYSSDSDGATDMYLLTVGATASIVPGILGNALQTSASGTIYAVDAAGKLPGILSGNCTVEFWMNILSSSTASPYVQDQGVFAYSGIFWDDTGLQTTRPMFHIQWSNSTRKLSFYMSHMTNGVWTTPTPVYSAGTASLDTWQHIAITKEHTGVSLDGSVKYSTIKMYINGVLDSTHVSQEMSTILGVAGEYVLFGTSPSPSNGFGSLINLTAAKFDDVCISSITKTASQVRTTYLNGIGYIERSEIFNTGSNTFSLVNPFPIEPLSRQGYTTTLLDDGTVLVCGGLESGVATSAYSHAMRYYPTQQSWSLEPSMSLPRTSHEAVLVGGEVYVMGGQSSISPTVIENSAEVYNPVTRTWRRLADMNERRVRFTAHGYNKEQGSRVIVFGGRTTLAGALSKTVEVFVPSDSDPLGRWYYMPSLDFEVAYQRGACLNPGDTGSVFKFLIPGGTMTLGPTTLTTSSQLYTTTG